MKGPGQWAELGRGGGEGRGVSVYRVLGGLDLRAHRLGEGSTVPKVKLEDCDSSLGCFVTLRGQGWPSQY